MKKIKAYIILFIFTISLIYITNITGIPNNIILFQGEKLELNTIFGINVSQSMYGNYGTIQVSSNINGDNKISEKAGKIDLKLNLLGKIPVKEVTVNVIPKTTVIPVGSSIGLKLYTNGVLVVGMAEIEGIENKIKPYEKSGIEEGDMIVSINEKAVASTAELIQTVNSSNGQELNIKYVREGEILETKIEPAQTNFNEYKLGLWVRDAAAGVGTVSFYEPSTGMFAALRTWNSRYRYRETFRYS